MEGNSTDTAPQTDKLIEMENVNPMDLLTSSEELESIQMYDSTVEIIGYVDNIESPKIVGTKQNYTFFKFFLNNGSGKRVQVVAWDDNVKFIEHHIMVNHVIHLDGVQARPPKIAHYNNGNLPYELLIRENTVVSNLGKFEPSDMMGIEAPEDIKLCEVLNSTKRIIVRGYIKTNFVATLNSRINKYVGCGAITDGTYKLEVHIMSFSDEDYYTNFDIKKGDQVELIGIMQSASNKNLYTGYYIQKSGYTYNKYLTNDALKKKMFQTKIVKV